MRKSNFFNFVISLFDGNHQPVEVHRASFKDFYDTHTVCEPIDSLAIVTFSFAYSLLKRSFSSQSGQEFRNGLIYKLTLVYSDGKSSKCTYQYYN